MVCLWVRPCHYQNNFNNPICSYFLIHYHLEVQANPKKNCTKKPMLFLASIGETGLSHDIFLKFLLGPFEVVEVKGHSRFKKLCLDQIKRTSFQCEKKHQYRLDILAFCLKNSQSK